MDSRDDNYRRRSPGTYDRRPRQSRNRSRSPPNIDRYQPSDRTDRSDRNERPPRDDYYRQRDDPPRRRASPPPATAGIDRYIPGQQEAVTVTTNPVPNPLQLDYQVGFTYFAEWWRVEQQIKEEKERHKSGGRREPRLKSDKEVREERGKQREQIQAAYDTYKEKLQAQMAKQFVLQHKGEEWFKERYVAQLRDELRPRLLDQRRQAFAKWQSDLDSGLFDEFTLEGIYKSESNGAGGIVEKEEGEATAANEVLGVGDLLPSRGGDIRDETSSNPTLLIKTIAPTVSRIKMEEFCREHLGEAGGGFKWLSLSDPNPQKKFHRIGWVMLNPGSTEPVNNSFDRGDGRDEDMDVDGEAGGIKSESGSATSVAAKALAEINGKTIKDEERGDFTCHVGIHEPPGAPRKKALWDLFSAPERIERDLELAIRLANKFDAELGDGFGSTAKIEEQVETLQGKGYLQPAISAVAPKKTKDADEMDDEEDEGAIEEDEEGAVEDEVDNEDLLAKKKKLDFIVEYLRRVHNFCIFCVFESDSVHELTRKCPGGHLRRPRASLTTSAKTAAKASAEGQPFPFAKDAGNKDKEVANGAAAEESKPKLSTKTQQQLQRAYNWVKTYEEKVLQILEPDNADITKLGGKPFEAALEEELSKYVKQEDESKWRCKVPECSKLFKGQNFWRKHVEKRHEDFFASSKQDISLVNAYVLDPGHIAPSRSDSNSNGHFPLNTHGMQSTPRGFNLQNLQQFGLPGMAAGGVMNPMHMGALLAQMNGGNAPFGGMDDERHGGGPMRRGLGQRYNNRGAGPYDRPNRDGRPGNQKWGGSGRLTPPRNGMGRGGAGGVGNPRFADGQGGSSREAVQGRSLKSYEDLDAAGGGGGGASTDALDY